MINNLESLEDQFRSYKETPSERSWSRLERRLDQDKGRTKSSKVVYYLSIAASIILLAVFMSWLFNLSGDENMIHEEELSLSYSTEFTVYQHVPEINEWYLIHDWSSIYEGDVHKNLKVTEDFVLPEDQLLRKFRVDDDSINH